jgi:transcriptional regulator with XRE-family HTH domain
VQRSQHDPGEVLRLARLARGWTQARLGRVCGCSASTISRWESGVVPLRDVSVMRTLAMRLEMSPTAFGLSADTATGNNGSAAGHGARLWRVRMPGVVEEDPVDRRAFLATAGAVGAGLALPGTTWAWASVADPAVVLEQRLATVLVEAASAGPAVTLPVLRSQLVAATAEFEDCQYRRLTDRLPALISAAEDTVRQHPSAALSTVVSQVYQLTARVLGKLAVSGWQSIAADRAARNAENSGDAVALAAARNVVASAARRSGHPEHAERISLHAAETLADTHTTSSAALREAGMLYCGAGYAAAVRGDRERSEEFYREATGIGRRIDDERDRQRVLANALSHRISAAYKLGDAAGALECARGVPLTALPTSERKARFLVDVAQAWDMFGEPVEAYKTLLAADSSAGSWIRHARRLCLACAISPLGCTSPQSRRTPEVTRCYPRQKVRAG